MYKLNITGNGITVDREVAEEVVAKIMAIVMGVAFTPSTSKEADNKTSFSSPTNGENSEAVPTPKAFLANKKPSSENERITTLAYYLTKYRGATKFKTADLTKLNTEAAQRNFSNAAVFVRNADREEYLSRAGGGSKQITVLGEAIVEALPDHEKVKQVITEHKSNRRRTRKNGKKKNKA